jgi:hypothetical protein
LSQPRRTPPARLYDLRARDAKRAPGPAALRKQPRLADLSEGTMFPSRYMPCAVCGASLERGARGHECERERRLEFELFQLRGEVDRFESDVESYLASPPGRFALYYAERERRRG